MNTAALIATIVGAALIVVAALLVAALVLRRRPSHGRRAAPRPGQAVPTPPPPSVLGEIAGTGDRMSRLRAETSAARSTPRPDGMDRALTTEFGAVEESADVAAKSADDIRDAEQDAEPVGAVDAATEAETPNAEIAQVPRVANAYESSSVVAPSAHADKEPDVVNGTDVAVAAQAVAAEAATAELAPVGGPTEEAADGTDAAVASATLVGGEHHAEHAEHAEDAGARVLPLPTVVPPEEPREHREEATVAGRTPQPRDAGESVSAQLLPAAPMLATVGVSVAAGTSAGISDLPMPAVAFGSVQGSQQSPGAVPGARSPGGGNGSAGTGTLRRAFFGASSFHGGLDGGGAAAGFAVDSDAGPANASAGGAEQSRDEASGAHALRAATADAGAAASNAATPAAEQSSVSCGVKGQVRRTDGIPVEDAVVTLIDLAGRQAERATTGTNGAYQVTAFVDGRYVLIASAETYQPQAATVEVGAGVVELDIVLSGAGVLHGVARTPDGTPVREATVVLADVHGDVVASAVTMADGEYAFEQLVAGSYTLAVSAEAYRPVARAVQVEESGETRTDVELVGAARLRGFATGGPDARPIPDALVTVLDAGGTVLAVTTTGLGGEYTFEDLPEGEYTVVATGYPPVANQVRLAGGETGQYDVEFQHQSHNIA